MPPASVGGKVEGASRPTFRTHTSKSQHQRGRQLTKASLHTRGISRARSFDLEVTPWAPTRLTSCIFHSGHTEAYEPLRSTRSSARAPFRDLAAPQSTRKPPVQCTRKPCFCTFFWIPEAAWFLVFVFLVYLGVAWRRRVFP